MKKSPPKDTNCVITNKLKLSEDASKIVQAMKKLHVPNTAVAEANDLGNGKIKLKLFNGSPLSHTDENASNKCDSSGTVSQAANSTPNLLANVLVAKVRTEKDVDAKNAVSHADKNGEEKVEAEEVFNDSFGSEEWRVLDETASDTSLNTSTDNKSCASTSTNSIVGNKDTSLDKLVSVGDHYGATNSIKRNSPVVFESTAKEEGMQIAVNKVVEKLLNELPGSEDMAVDEVKPLNGTDCRLFAELTKDNHTVAVLKRQKCGNESDKNIADDKETNVNPELRIKIDLKRKQANYIDSDDKTAAADMLTVKKVKIDSEVLIEEEKKVSPLKKELKVPEKNEEKDKLVRLSSKEMSAEIEKLAKKLLSNRSSTEIGELKLKVSTLEKKVDFWKRQYWNLQKEVTECNIGVQRVSQNLKKNVPFPAVKVSTRHVGLQVQQVQIPAVRAPLNMNRPSFTTKVVSQKDYRQDLPSIAPSPSTSIASPTKYIPATLPIAAVPTQKLQPSVSVSILQPKPQTNISLPSNLLVPSTGTSVIPKVASVVPPTAVPTVRSALDFQRKVQATSANPIPMRLVANQANQAAKQANPTAVRPTLTAVTPGAVKIIDLTADEDEAKAKRVTRAFQLAATTPAASLSNTTITPIKPANAVNITNQRPLAIFAAPVSQASVGTNQIFLAATQSSMVRYPVTSIRTTNSTQSLINSGSKLTYLVPTAGLPRGSLLIAPNQNRPLQLHPPIQTLLMQRGTTLFPVTSGTGTTQSIKTVVTPGIRNPTVVTAAVPVLTSSLPIQSGVQMTQMTSVQKPPAPVVTTTTASPVTPTITTSTNVNTNINTVTTTASTATASSTVDVTKQAVVVSRVSPKHPAPLPVFQTSIQSLNSTTLKHIPPKPALKISKVTNGIVLSWNMNLNTLHADISCYQLFAYQETSAAPSPTLWKKVGDVKALALPMACTLTQFVDGHKYHFAVRALDVHKRVGPFSDAGSIVLPTTSSSSTSTNATPTSK